MEHILYYHQESIQNLVVRKSTILLSKFLPIAVGGKTIYYIYHQALSILPSKVNPKLSYNSVWHLYYKTHSGLLSNLMPSLSGKIVFILLVYNDITTSSFLTIKLGYVKHVKSKN